VRTMKTKNTEWLPEEDAELRKAVETKVSPARLSVRLKRSEVSIKRRLRDLGLAAKSRSDAG
jgi:ParB-like chromosome segregation protein Spo0J